MRLLVVGSVAFDSIATPAGAVDGVLGGSATYFSLSASYFTGVRLVAVVGEDFPEPSRRLLAAHRIDLSGLQVRPGRCFRWSGEYGADMAEATTRDTQLNVFQDFEPALPEAFRDTPFVFLANIDPVLQACVLGQIRSPRLVACDTMNYWIAGKPEQLRATLARVDILFVNDAEARLLTGETGFVRAARRILALGPRAVVVKLGAFGAVLVDQRHVFFAPAYPVAALVDPTGAGDTFAGGFMGSLAEAGAVDRRSLRRAVAYGAVMASFAVESFSTGRLETLTRPEIDDRYRAFRALTRY